MPYSVSMPQILLMATRRPYRRVATGLRSSPQRYPRAHDERSRRPPRCASSGAPPSRTTRSRTSPPRSVEAEAALGLKGFWMGYFSGRAAPMGAVGPAVVVATFFNFAPWMVERALPDAWAIASPAEVLPTALRRRRPGAARAARAAGRLGRAARRRPSCARAAADACATEGRPLAAAWAGVQPPDDPHLAPVAGAVGPARAPRRRPRGRAGRRGTRRLRGPPAARRRRRLDARRCNSGPGAGTTTSGTPPRRGWSERGWLDRDGRLTEHGRVGAPPSRPPPTAWPRRRGRRSGAPDLDRFVDAMAPLHAAIAARDADPLPQPDGADAARRPRSATCSDRGTRRGRLHRR